MISGIILAAGSSSRMGQPKQLLLLRGEPLLQHAIATAVGSALDEIIVVLGCAADEIRRVVKLPGNGRVVVNPAYASGQTSSLRTGLGAVAEASQAAVILLGDQPDVRPETVRQALDLYRRTGGPVVRAYYDRQPGHPVVLDRRVWKQVAATPEDAGARAVLERHPEWVVPLQVRAAPPMDVDTPQEYRHLAGGE